MRILLEQDIVEVEASVFIELHVSEEPIGGEGLPEFDLPLEIVDLFWVLSNQASLGSFEPESVSGVGEINGEVFEKLVLLDFERLYDFGAMTL